MSIRELRIDPDPDFGRLEKVLRREGTLDRVPFYELFSNITDEVLERIGRVPAEGQAPPPGCETDDLNALRHINYMYYLGYDYLNAGATGFGFADEPRETDSDGKRSWVLAGGAAIASREDFERYRWPNLSAVDYSPLERMQGPLPDGMKVIAGTSGILENVMWLLGYEGIAYMLYEDESLVADTFEAVATRTIGYLENCASIDTVGAIQMGEDMGFKTQTMLSPAVYRKHLFPWHKKLVDAVHAHGKPIILHACGNLGEIMEDIIECGWDARHSFEDEIQPVWEAKEKYGDRIALMGGFDMDKICRLSDNEVRAHTRFLVEHCAPGGGWALGTGNSVADYIPTDNFVTMLEEGFLAGRL